jgi:hypothetical protein
MPLQKLVQLPPEIRIRYQVFRCGRTSLIHGQCAGPNDTTIAGKAPAFTTHPMDGTRA